MPLNPIFINLIGMLATKVIDKIFSSEKEKPETGRGPERREDVVGGIIDLIKEHEIVFDDIYGYVDHQVQLLKDRGILWSVGAEALNVIVNEIILSEMVKPLLPGSEKKKLLIDRLKDHFETMAIDIDDISGYIDDQVELFNRYHIFKK